MKIAILGSNGYLGKKLVKILARGGHNILCIKLAGTFFNDSEIENNPNIRICDIDDVEQLISHDIYDCFINLSCLYQRKGISDIAIFEANFYNPLKVFLLFLKNGISKHITIDTSLPKHLNAYCLSKKEYADVLKWYSQKNNEVGTKTSIVNILLENFYGEDEPKDRFIPSTIEKLKKNEEILLTEGNQRRDWIYVGDAIDAIVKLIENNNLPSYLDFPLGSGKNVEVREVIKYLKDITCSKSKLSFGAIEKRLNEPDTLADTSMMEMYGIEIKYHWKDGFKKVAKGD